MQNPLQVYHSPVCTWPLSAMMDYYILLRWRWNAFRSVQWNMLLFSRCVRSKDEIFEAVYEQIVSGRWGWTLQASCQDRFFSFSAFYSLCSDMARKIFRGKCGQITIWRRRKRHELAGKILAENKLLSVIVNMINSRSRTQTQSSALQDALKPFSWFLRTKVWRLWHSSAPSPRLSTELHKNTVTLTMGRSILIFTFIIYIISHLYNAALCECLQ